MTEVGDAIRAVLGDHSRRLVEVFFDPDNRFAGVTFDTLPPNDPDTFAASDVLAASLLDVPFLPRAVRCLLETDHARFGDALAAVPGDVDLWDATPSQLEPAYALWDMIRGLDGVGPTRASKLLARKRPRLIPVVDSVIRKGLGLGNGDAWVLLRGTLAADEAALVDDIERLRPLGLDPRVSTLRILDAALWMNLSRSTHVAPFREP